MVGKSRYILFEVLEPRILLSAEGLLNFILPDQDQDMSLDGMQQVVQYAELLETQEQVEEQVISDTSNSDNCQPTFTLFVDDDRTNGESGDVDLSVDNISPAQTGDIAVLPNDSNGDIEIKVGTTEDSNMPTYINDADSSIEYATSIEIRGPPIDETVNNENISNEEENNGTLIFKALASQNDLALRINVDDPTILELFDNKEDVVLNSCHILDTNYILIEGTDDADDTLTVDLGVQLPFNFGVEFNGGSGGFDSLVVIGNDYLIADYNAIGRDSGIINLSDGSSITTISFTGLEPVTVSNVTNYIFTTNGGADLISIHSPVPGQNCIMGTSGGVPFESVTFYDVASVTIDTGASDSPGDDEDFITIDTNGVVDSGLQNLNIVTGEGLDTVYIIIDDFVSWPAGTLTVDGGAGLNDQLIIEGTYYDDAFNISDEEVRFYGTVVDLAGVDWLEVYGSDGDDVVNVVPSASAAIIVDGGVGQDELIVNPEGAGVVFGENSILVNGMRSITYTAETEIITVGGLGSLRTEGTDNNALGTSTALPLEEDPVGSGYFVGRGLGSIQPVADLDWWSFEALAGDVISVSVDTPDSDLNPYVELYDTDQNLLVSDDNGGPDSDAFISHYEIGSNGMYYVCISQVYWSNSVGAYQLRVDLARGIQMESDANYGNGYRSGANELTMIQGGPGHLVVTVAGTLMSPDIYYDEASMDIDYFLLGTLGAGSVVELSIQLPSTSDWQGKVRVMDDSYHYVPDDDGNTDDEHFLGTVLSDGIYYAKVESTMAPVWPCFYRDGHYYFSTYYPMTWTEAEEYAQQQGGHLLAINDWEEEDWLLWSFSNYHWWEQEPPPYEPYDPGPYYDPYYMYIEHYEHEPQWIGLTDEAEEGTWIWSNGEEVTYTNWSWWDQPSGGTSYNWAYMQPYTIWGWWPYYDEETGEYLSGEWIYLGYGVEWYAYSQEYPYPAMIEIEPFGVGPWAQYLLDVDVLTTPATPAPDLRVSSVVTPILAKGGETIQVEWTVGNYGDDETSADMWFDRLVMSQNDQYGDLDDVGLALVEHVGILAAGQGYSAQADIQLPDGITGEYWLFVETDSTNQVPETTFFEDNNVFATEFTIDSSGPRIEMHIPSGALHQPVNHIDLQFNEPIDFSSFDLAEDIISFTGPAGAIQPTDSTWFSDTNTLRITFVEQDLHGHYELVVGPDILDVVGNSMDQDQDGMAGELEDDVYLACFDLLFSYYVTSHTPSGDVTEPVASVTVTFSEPILQNTFSGEDMEILGPEGTIAISGDPERVADDTYRVHFAEQGRYGIYHVYVGPHIENTRGVEMDQDLDGIVSEPLEDRYDAAFTILDVAGPKVLDHWPTVPVNTAVDHVVLSFNEAMDEGSLESSDFAVTGPGPEVTVSSVELQANDRDVQINFPAQFIEGTYLVAAGPLVADAVGNLMDQDEDGQKGEATDDRYSFEFVIDTTGPRAIAHSAGEVQHVAVRELDVTFSEAVDPATFEPGLVTVIGPVGSYPAEDVHWIDDITFRILIPYTELDGIYHVEIQPFVTDLAGNLLDQDADGLMGEDPEDAYVFEFEQRLPDLFVTDVTYPTEARPGQEIELRWTVTNIGQGPATGTWLDKVYWSGDDQVGADEECAAVRFDQPLAFGESYSRVVSVTVPDGIDESRWIVLRTDSAGELDENGADGNNAIVASPAVWITTRPYPDLQILDLVIPEVLSAGEKVMISWTVGNLGTGATTASYWHDALYLSEDDELNSADRKLVGLQNPDFLAPGESYTQNAQVEIPESIPRGSYFVLVKADTNDNVEEFNLESNNIAHSLSPVDVVTPPPGFLTVLSVEAPESAEPAGTIGKNQLTWTIQNTGGKTIPGIHWDDGVALSRDNVYDENEDLWLSGHLAYHEQPLAPGEVCVLTNYHRTPQLPTWEPGTYFLILVPDCHWRTGLTKNYGVAPITLAYSDPPDLQVSSVSGSATGVAGQEIELGWRVENQGAGYTRANTWEDRTYLSVDQLLDEGDIWLGSYNHIGLLNAGEGYDVVAAKFDLPSDMPAGNYYILVETDSQNKVYESNENNNILASVTTMAIERVECDLVVVSVLTSDTANAGNMVTVEWIVRNNGPDATPIGSWTDAIYLSEDAILDILGDKPLGQFDRQGTLDTEEAYSCAETVTLPPEIEGSLYLFIVADEGQNLYEYNAEGNNTLHRSIIITDFAPDLVVQTALLPATAIAGQTIEVDWSVINDGSAVAQPNWLDAFYLSQDSILATSTEPLAVFEHDTQLMIGETYGPAGGIAHITLPDQIEGTYYLFFLTDAAGTVYEKGIENNNIFTSEIEITDHAPDLRVQDASSSVQGMAGQFIDVDFSIINEGTESASGQWQDAFFLSADTEFDSGQDNLFGLFDHAEAVDVGATYGPPSVPAHVRLPDRIEGTFHIFVVADYSEVLYEKDEGDNVYLIPDPVEVVIQPADLQVSEVVAPISAKASTIVNMGWTVTNTGPEPTDEAYWQDGVYISIDDIFEPASDIELGVVVHTGFLGAGETYSCSESFELRQDLEGPYYVYVVTDVRHQVFEHTGETNNTMSANHLMEVIGVRADLEIESVQLPVPAIGVVGEVIQISWTVRNSGADPTPAASWFDTVYLSIDNLLDDGDFELGVFSHQGTLASEGQYVQTHDIGLPADMPEGIYFVLVQTDSSQRNDVYEYEAEGNNIGTAEIHLVLAPPADLQVTAVGIPPTAWSGQNLHVEWTVTNVGGAVASSPYGGWYDSVYLSRDPYLDPESDIHLGTVLYEGILAPEGGFYHQSLDARLPAGISGPYYVFVLTDTNDRVFERGLEGNNASAAPSALQINLTPPADLQVTCIAPPTSGIYGEPATWEYEVANIDTLDAMGAWYDTLYLSADQVWDIDDLRIARVYHQGDIPHGESYTESITADVPGVLPGHYYVIVRTDILNDLREINDTNNTGVSTKTIRVDGRELVLGEPLFGELNAQQYVYYQVTVGAGEDLAVVLGGDAAQGAEFYAAFEMLPTRSLYDARGTSFTSSGKRVRIPSTLAGTYFIMTYGRDIPASSPASYTLTASLLDFSIETINPTAGGNAGNVTIEIWGTHLPATVAASVVPETGERIVAEAIYRPGNEPTIFATFDLFGADLGLYSIEVEDTVSGAVASLNDAFEVLPGGGSEFECNLVLPSLFRPAWDQPRQLDGYLEYANTGTNDLFAPLLTITASTDAIIDLDLEGCPPTDTARILALNPDGPAMILPPGTSVQVPVSVTVPSDQGTEFTVTSLGARPGGVSDDPIDWVAFEADVRPEGIDLDTWNQVFSRLQAQIGETWADYVDALRVNAARWFAAGKRVYCARKLFGIEMDEAYGLPTHIIAGRVINAETDDPVIGVTVRALNTEALGFGESQTTGDGQFIIYGLAPGTCEVSVERHLVQSGHAVDMPATGDLLDVEIAVLAASHVSGWVTDAATGEALADAVISVTGLATGVVEYTVTDDSGQYYFGELPADTYIVECDARDYVGQAMEDVEVTPSLTTPASFQMTLGGQILGRVTRASDGVVIQGAEIRCYGQDQGHSNIVYTDSDGQYGLTGLPDDSYVVTATAPDLRPSPTEDVMIQSASVQANIDFELQSGASVAGQVLDHLGAPVVGAKVVCLPRGYQDLVKQTETDSGGMFQIAGLPAGEYELWASSDGLALASPVQFELAEQEEIVGLKVHLVCTGDIEGTVVSAVSSEELAEATILAEKDGVVYDFTVCGETGSFAISDLPAGTYDIRAYAAGYAESTTSGVEVMAGRTTTIDIALELTGSITGIVQCATSGLLLQKVKVNAWYDGGARVSSVTDESGSYAFSGLVPGSYEITVHGTSGGGASGESVVLRPGAELKVNLAVPTIATVGGTIFASDDHSAIPHVSVYLCNDSGLITRAETNTAGDYGFYILEPGTYHLVAAGLDTSFAVHEGLTVGPGDEILDVDFRAGDQTISGRIVSVTTGEGIANADVFVELLGPAEATFSVGYVNADEEGYFQYSFAASGLYRLTATAEGWDSESEVVTVDEGQGASATIHLEPALGTSGIVVRADTGEPVEDAHVYIFTSASQDDFWVAITDTAGRWAVQTLSQGIYDVVVVANGYRRAVLDSINIDSGNDTLATELVPADTSISGIVVDANGNPLARALLQVIDSRGYPAGYTLSDGDGKYMFMSVSSGTYSILASCNGHQPLELSNVVVEDGDELVISEITLLPKAVPDIIDAHFLWNYSKMALSKALAKKPSQLPFLLPPPTVPACEGCADLEAKATNAHEKTQKQYWLYGKFYDEFSNQSTKLLREYVWSSMMYELYVAAALLDLVPGGSLVSAIPSVLESARDLMEAIFEFKEPDRAVDKLFARWRALYAELLSKDGNLMKLAEKQGAKWTFKVGKYVPIVGLIFDTLSQLEYAERLEAARLQFFELLYKLDSQREICELLAKRNNALMMSLYECDCTKTANSQGDQEAKKRTDPSGSHDPNDKLGPGGYDALMYIAEDSVLPYTIRFENDPDATAPAVLVTITDQLNEDLDWSTFELGDMQFGSHLISVPDGLTYCHTQIDLRPEGNDLIVDIEASFNTVTGLAEWTFTGIDPATGELTWDPLAGFLPPNNPEVHDGEGFVKYTVRPKVELPSGTEITNVATIVFDWNEPMDTPLVHNTIDSGAPSSAVDSLPAVIEEESFEVNWSGADDAEGSGLSSYDIYVSTDAGPYQLWLDDVTANSAVFVGEYGHSYAFYSVARDNVGHIEGIPEVADAQTYINTRPAVDIGLDQSLNEGELLARIGSFVDDDIGDAWTATVDYGDGLGPEPLAVESKTLNLSHAYVDDGTYLVTVIVTDSHGASGTGTFTITVNNVAPTLTLNGPAETDEGAVYTLSLSSTDPGDDTISCWTLDWGDDTIEPVIGNPGSVDHIYTDGPNTYMIYAQATDEDGTYTANPVEVTINNVAPIVALSGPAMVDEGSVYGLTLGAVTDPGQDTVTEYIVHWCDGTTDTYTSIGDVTHTYSDGHADHVIVVDLLDEDGTHAGAGTLAVTVANVTPTIILTGPAGVEEGAAYVLTLGAVTDPGEDTVTEYIVHWGDGGMDTYSNGGDVTHVYADGPANHTIVVDLVDEDGTHPESGTLDVLVNNVAPSLANATFELEENSPNGTCVGTISGSDPGDDTLTYSVVGGNGVSAFAIDATTGRIIITDETQLDYETTLSFTLEVQVTDDDNATDTATVTIDLLNQASITGVVFVDVNENGVYEANEPGIDGITIELLDDNSVPVLDALGNPPTATTSDGGFYLFEDLNLGTYLLCEVQPTGVDDGEEILGSLGGTIPANDTMQLTLERIDATDYNFAELGQVVTSGDTATIGFWQNKHGQELIIQGGTALAGWLTSNFRNVFGDTFIGGDGDDVASFYRDQLFRQKSERSAGPAKVDAQFMAVALATYFTSSNLAGNVASAYGFNVTNTGIGTKLVNVDDNGAAFSVSNGADLTIMQLLLATNDLTDQPDSLSGCARIYDLNGDGEIDVYEALLRTLANNVFSGINEQGDI